MASTQRSCTHVIFEVRQQRVTVDRSANLDFALVVEDYLMGARFATSRRTGSPTAEATELAATPPAGEQPLENGSIMCVLVDGFLDYAKLREAKLAQNPNLDLIPARP